jgi:hypothetical protein
MRLSRDTRVGATPLRVAALAGAVPAAEDLVHQEAYGRLAGN